MKSYTFILYLFSLRYLSLEATTDTYKTITEAMKIDKGAWRQNVGVMQGIAGVSCCWRNIPGLIPGHLR